MVLKLCGWVRGVRLVAIKNDCVTKRYAGPKREEAPGYWRRLHNGECQEQICGDDMGRVCGTGGQERKADRVLVMVVPQGRHH